MGGGAEIGFWSTDCQSSCSIFANWFSLLALGAQGFQ